MKSLEERLQRHWELRERLRSRTPPRRMRVDPRFGALLDDEQYAAILKAQGGRCAICRALPSAARHLAVDHDHETGKVRGLLCYRCNVALGHFQDSEYRLASAILYLAMSREHNPDKLSQYRTTLQARRPSRGIRQSSAWLKAMVELLEPILEA